jgi:glycosyltransferase involved in cell wall biosynthesis
LIFDFSLGFFIVLANKLFNILIITARFAPSALVGSKRFTFLTSHLDAKCCNVHVLTTHEKYLAHKDLSLHYAGSIHRTVMFPPFPIQEKGALQKIFARVWRRYLCFIDPYTGWLLPAFVKGLNILRKHKIQAIIVSGPPFSPVVTALFLCKIARIKLIIDYRDPWTTHPWTIQRFQGNRLFKKLNCFLERIAVKSADALVFCSRKMKDVSFQALRKYTSAEFYVVHNGFNPNNNIQPLFLEQNTKTLLYAGNFYGDRRINLLLDSIFELVKTGVISRHDLCIHIFSRLREHDKAFISQHSIGDIIKLHIPVDYYTILRYMKGADILFLPSGISVKYALPYKFFDYLSVRRPILALVPKDSAVASLMSEVDCGEVAFMNNPLSVQRKIKEMILDKKNYSFTGVDNYTWNRAAEEYANIINSVINDRFIPN